MPAPASIYGLLTSLQRGFDMFARYDGGFVRIETDTGCHSIMADRADPAASLRALAEEHRERAFRLLERAVLMDQAADRLE